MTEEYRYRPRGPGGVYPLGPPGWIIVTRAGPDGNYWIYLGARDVESVSPIVVSLNDNHKTRIDMCSGQDWHVVEEPEDVLLKMRCALDPKTEGLF